ncbi:Sporulation lipoprotein [compost metagenome]
MALDGVNTAIVMVTNENAYVAIMIDSTATGTKGSKQETNNAGTDTGIYNPYNPDSDSMPPHVLNSGVNNYETSMYHDKLSHRFKQTIAQKIRTQRPDLLDVYISANRDFINAMNHFAIVNWKGLSLQNELPQFNQTVTQIFGTEQQLPNR